MKIRIVFVVFVSLFLLLSRAQAQIAQPLKAYSSETPTSSETKKYVPPINLNETAYDESYHMFHFKDTPLARREVEMHVENFFGNMSGSCTDKLGIIPFPGLLMCYQSRDKNFQVLTGSTGAKMGLLLYYKF